MRKEVITIHPDTTVYNAAKKMFEEDITSLVVKETDKESIYGIITRKDIVNKVISCEKDIQKVKVSEIMSEPLMTISGDTSIENASRLMAKVDVRRFPIMDDGKIVGILSNSDIIRSICNKLKKECM